MPMRCWAVSAWLALAPLLAVADGSPDAPALRAEAAGPGKTRLVFGSGPAVVVTRDKGVPPAARASGVELLGRLGERVVIVADRYRSRLNTGGGQCGAGEERFLRVIRLAPAPAKETYRTKLASCWDDIELRQEGGGVQWAPASGELRIDWLQGPALRLHIDADGSVKELKPA